MDNSLPTCVLLVGNKVDLDSEREVLAETGEMSAKVIGKREREREREREVCPSLHSTIVCICDT